MIFQLNKGENLLPKSFSLQLVPLRFSAAGRLGASFLSHDHTLLMFPAPSLFFI